MLVKVYTGSRKCYLPPKCEPSVRNLVETRSLSVRELLELHRLFKAGVVEHNVVVPQVELILINSEARPLGRRLL